MVTSMLSRVADSLYWMSRYLERAEHTARLIDINCSLSLEQPGVGEDRRWSRLLACLSLPPSPTADFSLVQTLTYDLSNRSSVVYSIMAARENARQVREQISSEMWEQLNRLFHRVRQAGIEELPDAPPTDFLAAVKEGTYLFQGITDSTMNHGEGWQFIQAGRYLERAAATAALLDVHFREFLLPSDWAGDASDYLEWIGLLKSCTAFEAYCKVYTADLSPNWIAEFLLLNEQFPHSIRFAVDRVHKAMQNIHENASSRKADRLERFAGRLKATLGFGQVDEILASGLHAYLEGVQWHCAQIHSAMQQIYITYPIESALEA